MLNKPEELAAKIRFDDSELLLTIFAAGGGDA